MIFRFWTGIMMFGGLGDIAEQPEPGKKLRVVLPALADEIAAGCSLGA